MTDEQKQKMAEEYADFDCHEYGDEREIAIDCYLAGLNRGIDESKVLREALEEAREQFALMAEGEGTDYRTYIAMSYAALADVNEALQHTSKKEVNE